MLELDDSETDLRAGVSLWDALHPPERGAAAFAGEARAGVAIIGAGITGSLLAERLTREGRTVVLIDRHKPQQGSTAASTALLQWEIDAPMLELEERCGFDAAARIYQRSRASVGVICDLCASLRLPCDLAARDAFYLSGNALDPVLLKEECALRQRAGLPSHWLSGHELAAVGLVAEAALRSEGAAEVDPAALARGLLNVARQRGAQVFSGVEAQAYEMGAHGVTIACDTGAIVRANYLLLANGYEMPAFAASSGHRITSTWAIATAALAPHWPSRALVWEAAEPYAYLRTSADGRIIIGGGDEDIISDPNARDAMTPEKIALLRDKLKALAPGAGDVAIEYAWAGLFGETDDALPLIGAVPNAPRTFAAFGYGGNGITFSAMAAEIVANALRGQRDEDAALYALDRFD